jgi:hypothetical protein
MKLALAILALIVFALSFWADYKWRQWMKTRRSSSDPHDRAFPPDPDRHS